MIMEKIVENIENNERVDLRFLPTRNLKQAKKRRLSKRTRDYIFIFIMLLYPVAQFLFTWGLC